MEEYRQEIIISAVVVYMIFCVLTGLWAMRRTHNASDFFIAGRGLGPIVVSLAIFSSTLSGFGFVGGPGLVLLNWRELFLDGNYLFNWICTMLFPSI